MEFDFRNGPVRVGSDEERFNERIMIVAESGCHIWMGEINTLGYGYFKTDKKRHLAHRFSYQVEHGEIPRGLVVRHQCDTPSCVNPNHLVLGTQRENVLDSVRRGRANRAKGSALSQSKLTEDDVAEIRKTAASDCEIARRFGVHHSTIRNIRIRKTWKHLP